MFWKKRNIQVSRQQMLEQFGRKNREILEAISGKSYTEEEAEALATEKRRVIQKSLPSTHKTCGRFK